MALPGGYLLDTNIVLALVRGNPLGLYLDGTYGLTGGLNPFIISVVTVGEIFALVEKFKAQGHPWGPKKLKLLEDLLRRLAWEDISDPAILRAYGEIDCFADSKGRPMGKNDVWIAATARVTNTTLLTTDKDFDLLHGIWLDREWVDPISKLGP